MFMKEIKTGSAMQYNHFSFVDLFFFGEFLLKDIPRKEALATLPDKSGTARGGALLTPTRLVGADLSLLFTRCPL